MLPPNLLPPGHLTTNAFIAGGYAACPALATDIDVWITVPTYDLDHARSEILRWLHEQDNLVFEELTDGRVDQVHSPDGYGTDLNVRKVATVEHYRGTKYHLLVVDGDVDAVLDSFDVSTHQVALTPFGVVTGENWTPTNVYPVQLRDTPTTAARMAKIAARYGYPAKETL